MRRTALVVLAVCALAAVVVPVGSGAERMWVGFHDDPSFRWVPDRVARIQRSARDGSTINRLLVQWNLSAPQRPSSPTDPFDPAYNFDDLDESIRASQEADQEVMLTISGTPGWANGGRRPNVMPRRLADFTAFARAIASRYSGRHVGFPFVRFWAIWNEPNLNLFLTPQFNSAGRSVAPANYARIYAAGYAGIKAGSPRAKIGIGETSARGRDRRVSGLSDTHSPGKFAELVARANPRLKFDAWTHHPYPFNPNSKPTQVVKWPNVSLASLPRFHEELQKWFKRKKADIWVTEYGHQTKPPDQFGISYAKQSAYIAQSIALVRKLPYVPMFIWFVYQDDQGQPWESGLYTQGGSSKGERAVAVREDGQAARPEERGLLLPRRDADAAGLALHAEVLRQGPGRDADRDDVARLPVRAPDRGRPAVVAARGGLHGHRPASLQRRAADGLHRDVRDERPQRHGPHSPPDHPRVVERHDQRRTCIPSHHWGAPRARPVQRQDAAGTRLRGEVVVHRALDAAPSPCRRR